MTISIDHSKAVRKRKPQRSESLNDFKAKINHVGAILRKTFVEFCFGTNLHGFSQIVEVHKDVGHPKVMKYLERISSIMWTIFILINFVFAIFLFSIVLMRYRTTPTITSIYTTNYPISKIKFPGVAICNVNSVWKPNTPSIIEKLQSNNVSNELIQYFLGNVTALVNFVTVNEELFAVMDVLQSAYNYTIEKIMKELAMPCDKFLYKCEWLGKTVNCSSIFKMVRTGVGFCCAFNYKESRGGDANDTGEASAIYLGGAGEDFGLKAVIDIDPENYVASRKLFYGSEVIVFDSEGYPQKHYISDIVQHGHGVTIGVKPSVFSTSDNVKTYPIDLRGCLYDYERELSVTADYSFESCIVQCRAMEAIKRCNCLPYMYPQVYYPNANGNKMRQCSFKDLECLQNNKHVFFSIKSSQEVYAILNISSDGLDCDCLPSCEATTYDNEICPLKRRIRNDSDDMTNSYRMASVSVFYKYRSCTRYLRQIYMTWDDLLGSFGGIFGLCLGASIFSIAEIIYYFVVSLLEKAILAKMKSNAELENDLAKQFMIQYYKPMDEDDVLKMKENPIRNRAGKKIQQTNSDVAEKKHNTKF